MKGASLVDVSTNGEEIDLDYAAFVTLLCRRYDLSIVRSGLRTNMGNNCTFVSDVMKNDSMIYQAQD